jgi:4-amino-4-deoxy-L-arabinose transferase-like glycosyltransferase
MLKLTVRAAGDEPLVLRALSVLLGLLTVALIARFAQELFGSPAGYLAALLAATSPELWWASQEIRMYSLVTLAIAFAALAWHRLITAPVRRNWLMLWCAELLLLYSHSIGPVPAIWLNAVTVALWIVRRDFRRPDWRTWFAGQIAVALLWSPWMLTHFVRLSTKKGLFVPPALSLALFSGMWQSLWAGAWAMVGHEPALVNLSAVLFVLTLLLVPWTSARGRWLALHVLVLVFGLLSSLIVGGVTFHGRYLIMIVPLLLALLAGGLARLAHRAPPAARWRPVLAAACLAPFLLDGALGIYLATANPDYARDDVQGMVRYYAKTLGAGDTVLVWSFKDRFDLEYYWTRLGVRARRVVLPGGADLDDIVPLLPRSGRVAVNVWFGERADYRGMLPCVLAHGAPNPPVEYAVYGMKNLLYPGAPAELPALQLFDGRFEVAQVTGRGALPPYGDSEAAFTADQALCLPVRVTLAHATVGDLKAAVIVKNALGWEVAHADALLSQADLRASSAARPGAALTGFALLRLPYGAPPGDYTLSLRLYDDGQPSGYDALGANGLSSGKDLPLGAWRVAPGADWSRVTRTSDLPVTVDIPAGGVTLVAHDVDTAQPIHNGDTLQWSLLWRGSGALPDLTLAATDGSWRVAIAAPAGPHAPVTLDWRTARVPVDASGGTAELRLPGGAVVATYTVEALPAAFVPPAFGAPVDASVPGVGTLAGFTLDGTTFARSTPISITLVWRAGASTPAVDDKVFVHLIAADGRLIAQSDAFPAQDTRPMTGWRPGEYVVDTHQVQFHADATPGPAVLRVGLYDPETNVRVRFADGSDYVTLPVTVEVK